jgi:hypothetical protein
VAVVKGVSEVYNTVEGLFDDGNPPPATTSTQSVQNQIMDTWGSYPHGAWCGGVQPGYLPGGISNVRVSMVQNFATDAELDQLASEMRAAFNGDGPRGAADLRKVGAAFWEPALFGALRGLPTSTPCVVFNRHLYTPQATLRALVDKYKEVLVYDPEVHGTEGIHITDLGTIGTGGYGGPVGAGGPTPTYQPPPSVPPGPAVTAGAGALLIPAALVAALLFAK